MRKPPIPPLAKLRAADGTVVDIQALLTAPYEDIGEAASILPPHIGWFGSMAATAKASAIRADFDLKRAKASAYMALKNDGQFEARGFGSKPTDKALEYAVCLDPAVIAAVEAYAKAEYNYDRFKWCIQAIMAKLDLVRSSETTRRMEHEPDKNKGTVV